MTNPTRNANDDPASAADTPSAAPKRTLTDAQRKALELLAKHKDGEMFLGNHTSFAQISSSTAESFVKRGFAEWVSQYWPRRIRITPIGLAALGTRADSVPRADWMAHDFGGGDGLPQDDIHTDDTPSADDVPRGELPPPFGDDNDDPISPDDDSTTWDDPLAQAALNDIAAFVAGPEPLPFDGVSYAQMEAAGLTKRVDIADLHPAPSTPTADAATDGDVATLVKEFDRLLEGYKRSNTSMLRRSWSGYIAQFATDNAATIRAALVGNAPSVLRVGDTAVVLRGYGEWLSENYPSSVHLISDGDIVSIEIVRDGKYQVSMEDGGFVANIPTRFLRRIEREDV